MPATFGLRLLWLLLLAARVLKVAFTSLLILVCSTCSHAALLTWHSEISKARAEASLSKKGILIFFDDPTTPLGKHNTQLLKDPKAEETVGRFYVPVRLGFHDKADLAKNLHVFKGGTIGLYTSEGTPLVQITEILPPQEFLSVLVQHRTVTKNKTATATTSKTSLDDPYTTIAFGYPAKRGIKVAGPIEAPLRSAAPITLGLMEAGKQYLLVLEGTGSAWAAQLDGLDPLYIYKRPRDANELKPSRLLHYGPDAIRFEKLVRAATGNYPVYNPNHRYEFVIRGTGDDLIFSLKDLTAKDQVDNRGAFLFSLYEVDQSGD